ncbi:MULTISPECIES: thioredoxin-disulfide reductase [unclassified Oceanispirochaeta]|uniref:thioredoxin-disulfide reductase n=1 Tax=unclassified Oceanispirochaeta TaxID=2635722 RepID=UPI000E09B85A|nr:MULTISPECIES: thioredoxin-disulfide reductase [unclassified Oceanispirochaeta]MBF9014816.1 thioredoxin-disulfide reductase [Oceanispirochaeta sp. M2]NPD71072.1 thioredoxin-disulfide reductase [Oceanispirochaeta sp. M1]RDG33905.1 thioredoxin-disulfide reductase [Oceanispirochaeta sp. M1]
MEKDMVIIGGGIAGLSAAQYGARSNLKTLVIEEMAPGGQALLISDLENYPGFPEPVNGFQLSMDMHKQAQKFGAEFLTASVRKVSKKGNDFIIETSKDTITAKTVVLATGAKHRHLDVPGEEEFGGRGVSYCATCDGPFFKNKKMLVVGGGDAACDEANYLANLTDKVVMVHRKDRFRAQKAVADRVLKNPNIEVRFNTIVKEIKGNETKLDRVVLAKTDSDEVYEENFDATFIFVGSIPQTQLVPEVKMDETGYVITDVHMESSVKGLYAVGDVRDTPFRQIITAASDGAVAAHTASGYIDDLKGEAYI